MSTDTDIAKVSILGQDSIHLGFHLAPHIAHTVCTALPSSTYVLVTDSNIARLHLDTFSAEFTNALSASGSKARFITHVVPPGETTKSREGKAEIEDFMLAHACTRDTVLLALGGGVIGDLVGFVAATFMRGIRFVQIPTTLLAMVDSSVGGKTAIDTPAGKNLIGAFWQPSFIFIDAAFLETLPPREFRNGMAEVVKTAAIWDEDEFTLLESRSTELFAAISTRSSNSSGRTLSSRSSAQSLLVHVIQASIGVKAHIVTIDERETGLRNLVNFGHTIGHALEAVLTPQVLHGEAVAVGIVLEAEVARARGVLGQVAVGRLVRALKAYGLPVSVHDALITKHPSAHKLTVENLLNIMKVDKKNAGAEKKIVLLSRIGKTYEEKATGVSDALIARTLSESATILGAPHVAPHQKITMATPGSKSISNRALVLAALGEGTCRLTNLLHSDDTQVMMAALQDLQGAKFAWEDNGETLVVTGGGGSLKVPPKGKELYLGNAGTAARFLTTVCALVQPSGNATSGEDERTIITGNARMKQRPIGPLVDALRTNGTSISYLESSGCLPLSISPAGLKGGRIELAASVSSQYVSSVLLCAPYAQEEVVLALVGGQVISQPYIDMTVAMMKTFGIHVERLTDDATGKPADVYRIPRGVYTNPPKYAVESDASSATYPLAIAALTGTTCTLSNIGSASLQGDARFAMDVLKPMGCEVIQTENETTVKGPEVGTLRALGEVDMEPMTDAFLTASVLAAVAVRPAQEGRMAVDGRPTGTRILGIANQRVKECNRIKAMIDELAKFGIETKELDDGLEVYGRPHTELKSGVVVHCYDDHRVAMAHSVLAALVPGTVLDEKRCVEKTWPNWWDDLENKIGLKVEGVELPAQGHASGSSSTPAIPASTSASTSTQTQTSSSTSSDASVLLIGMRGSGKSFIGSLAAQTLGWPLLDADVHFANVHNTGVREFVHEHGWPAFREAETKILKDLLAEGSGHAKRTVISLGGGIVETPEARDVLKAWSGKGSGRVVHVVRPIEEVVAYLGEETARPAYGEPVEEVFKRREPWFKECSTHEFVNHTTGVGATQEQAIASTNANNNATSTSNSSSNSSTEGVRREIARFFGHITGTNPNLAPNLVPGKRSYFLSLTFSDVTPALVHLDELAAGSDALELRVDLLRAPADAEVSGAYIPPRAYVAAQVAAIRKVSTLPIVYTVRTVSQGGSFPDGQEDEAFELFELGLQLAAEYIDVEITWSEERIRSFAARKGSSQIIASWHDWTGAFKWDSEQAKERYAQAAKLGDIVKIVGKANSLADNYTLRQFVSDMAAKDGAKAFIAINMGVHGQLSRVLNETFSPVTHPNLPAAAAPGQMSVAEVHRTLTLLGQLPSRSFYLLGSPIAHSMSPTLHNTAFGALGLPHQYGLLETADAEDARIVSTLHNPAFGGASVTIPLKEVVGQYLQELSPAAKAIGAVNTIILQNQVGQNGQRTLKGENTDWAGIAACVRARMPAGTNIDVGFVIGAGGTARAAVYALCSLGAETVYIYNRTQARAEAVRDAFPNANVVVIDELTAWPAGAAPPSVIIGTVPAPAQDALALPILSDALLAAPHGVMVDMAYKPATTPLVAVAEAKEGWAAVRGIEVLLEQGYEQLWHWTGRRVPREKIKVAVMEGYERS